MNEKIRALVADDNANLRDLLKCVLEMQDVDVSTAIDGRDAVRQAMTTRFDMIFTDIGMPNMDGLTAVRLIREHEVAIQRSPAKIVIVSAYGSPSDIEAARRAGADGHVTKPFSVDDFLRDHFGVERPDVSTRPAKMRA